ncbi:MAG: DUF5753 domain-containing protein [Humibacter sp.]
MNRQDMRAKRALQALRAQDQRGTGRVSGGLGPEAVDRLADLDSCTLQYRAWSPEVIPGLLQTPAYAAGAIKAHTPDMDVSELGHLVERRRRRNEQFYARRATLLEPTPLVAWFIIGEAAIRRPLMNAHSHADQLRHLCELSQNYPNIIVQVMPEDSPIPVVAEPFSLFFLDPGPTVAHLETVIGGWYSVAEDDIRRLKAAYSDMTARAMSTRDSWEYIKEELSLCSRSEATTEPTS